MKNRIDVAAIAPVIGTPYPPAFSTNRAGERRGPSDVVGLIHFGVNLLRDPPFFNT
jgi:hypothetical protein